MKHRDFVCNVAYNLGNRNYIRSLVLLIRYYRHCYEVTSHVTTHLLHASNRRGQFSQSLMGSMTRVKNDCATGSFSPSRLTLDHRVRRVRQEQKMQESFRPTLEGYCFGYRGFALFPPTIPIVRSFLNVAFSVTNSSFSLRIALHLCRRNQRCDRVPRFSASNLFNVSHSAGSLSSLARMNASRRQVHIQGWAPDLPKSILKANSLAHIQFTYNQTNPGKSEKLYIIYQYFKSELYVRVISTKIVRYILIITVR